MLSSKRMRAIIIGAGLAAFAFKPGWAESDQTMVPSLDALELFDKFSTAVDSDEVASLAIADRLLNTEALSLDDDVDLRLVAARAALDLGAPSKAVELILTMPEIVAVGDSRRTTAKDFLDEAYRALGDDRAALAAAIDAFLAAQVRFGASHPALLPRLTDLERRAESVAPTLLPMLAAERAKIDRKQAEVRAEGKPVAITVWYGTNRIRTEEKDPSTVYGRDLGTLVTGRAIVTIPPEHRPGEIERPSSWSLTSHPDPEKHVVLAEVEEMARDAFAAGCCAEGDRLLFVHGYNVTFEQGALRAAQLFYDLEFDGSAMLYSWPSRSSLLGYLTDANNVLPTRPAFEEFLELASRGSGELHIIAHSMGNRYLLAALESFLQKNPDRQIGQLVLAAPDVDRDEFSIRLQSVGNQIAGATLYTSKHDMALRVSRRVNGAYRAGDANGGPLLIAGLDTIDASLVEADTLGHSYFGDAPELLGDLLGVIEIGLGPDQRCGVRKQTEDATAVAWGVMPHSCGVAQVHTADVLLREHGMNALMIAQERMNDAPGTDTDFWLGVMEVVRRYAENSDNADAQ